MVPCIQLMMRNIGFLLLFLAQLHIQASGQPDDVQYVFEVQVHTYMNSENLNAFGQCCDGRRRQQCRVGCRNFFQFCLRLAGTSAQSSSCPLGLLQFNVDREDDDIVFSNDSSISNGVALENPLVFEGRRGQPWPAQGGQLLVAVFNDHDNDNDPTDLQLVDTIFIEEPNIQPGSSFSNIVVYSGSVQNTIVQIELSFRLRCRNNYFGDNCETLCIPQDNDVGHFACDVSGNVVCLAGYSDAETQCTKCIPAEGCVTNQGYCEQPGECKCHSRYTGALCETAIEAACVSGELCLNGGSCVIEAEMERGYRCECTGEFQGEKCEIIPSANTNDNLNGNINSSIVNSTKGTSDPAVVEQGQRTGGLVAGIVIPILLVLTLLAVAGVVIAVVWYRYKPHQKVLKSKQREALENPTYNMIPVISLADSTAVLTHNSQSNGRHTNGGPLFQSVDNSDPLYASTAIDGGTDGDYVIYDTAEGMDFEPRPLTTNTLPTPQSNRGIKDQSYSRSMENLLEPNSASASTHIGSTQSTPSKVNPYGNYGDKTLQRVASNFSLNDKEASNENVFDNPDYEDVHLDVTTTAETDCNGAAAVGNNDYEDIYDKDKDYDEID